MKKRLGALLLAASMVVSTVALGGCSSGKPAETKAATEAAAPMTRAGTLPTMRAWLHVMRHWAPKWNMLRMFRRLTMNPHSGNMRSGDMT